MHAVENNGVYVLFASEDQNFLGLFGTLIDNVLMIRTCTELFSICRNNARSAFRSQNVIEIDRWLGSTLFHLVH